MHWALLLGIAVISDILDYFGAAIPVIGDVLDLLTTGILFPYIGIESAAGLIELAPGVDILPTYTLLVLHRIIQVERREQSFPHLDIPRKPLRK